MANTRVYEWCMLKVQQVERDVCFNRVKSHYCPKFKYKKCPTYKKWLTEGGNMGSDFNKEVNKIMQTVKKEIDAKEEKTAEQEMKEQIKKLSGAPDKTKIPISVFVRFHPHLTPAQLRDLLVKEIEAGKVRPSTSKNLRHLITIHRRRDKKNGKFGTDYIKKK